jgi:hypothetical protein
MRDSGRFINNKELLKKLPDHLQAEISDMEKYNGQIREALKDEEMAQLFFKDPGQALGKIGIPLSPELKARLEKNPMPSNTKRVKTYTLKNGQTMNVNVTVKFTPLEEP